MPGKRKQDGCPRPQLGQQCKARRSGVAPPPGESDMMEGSRTLQGPWRATQACGTGSLPPSPMAAAQHRASWGLLKRRAKRSPLGSRRRRALGVSEKSALRFPHRPHSLFHVCAPKYLTSDSPPRCLHACHTRIGRAPAIGRCPSLSKGTCSADAQCARASFCVSSIYIPPPRRCAMPLLVSVASVFLPRPRHRADSRAFSHVLSVSLLVLSFVLALAFLCLQ